MIGTWQVTNPTAQDEGLTDRNNWPSDSTANPHGSSARPRSKRGFTLRKENRLPCPDGSNIGKSSPQPELDFPTRCRRQRTAPGGVPVPSGGSGNNSSANTSSRCNPN